MAVPGHPRESGGARKDRPAQTRLNLGGRPRSDAPTRITARRSFAGQSVGVAVPGHPRESGGVRKDRPAQTRLNLGGRPRSDAPTRITDRRSFAGQSVGVAVPGHPRESSGVRKDRPAPAPSTPPGRPRRDAPTRIADRLALQESSFHCGHAAGIRAEMIEPVIDVRCVDEGEVGGFADFERSDFLIHSK